MEIYQQIHDFTGAGADRFAEFIQKHSAEGISPEALRMACLGVLEDNLNGVGGPLAWELAGANSRDGQPHTFIAEIDDLIIEAVDPEQDHSEGEPCSKVDF